MELHDKFVAAVCQWAVERGDPVRGGDEMHSVGQGGYFRGRIR